MSSSTRTILGVLLILVITFCATFIVSRKTVGLGGMDLTEAKLYTLTEGTRSIIDKLPQPLQVKLFYSKEGVNKAGTDGLLLEFNNYYFYVRDLLRAYERHGEGKIIFTEYDPKAFSDAEAEADRLKMTRLSLGEREGFYFGIAVTSESGAEEVIPFLDLNQQERIEYKVSEALEMAIHRRKTNVGLLSPLPLLGSGESEDFKETLRRLKKPVPPGPWFICQALERTYNLQRVPINAAEISEDLDYLLVVHPKVNRIKGLSQETQYAIDQFVLRGGKVMVFVDPFCYADEYSRTDDPFAAMEHTRDSNLDRLLASWGLDFATRQGEDCLVAGDLSFAGRIPDPSKGDQGLTRFPGYMLVMPEHEGEECINQESLVTQGLEVASFLIPGALKIRADASANIEPLIMTTSKGNTWPVNTFELADLGGVDVGRLTNRFREGSEAKILAVEITGNLKTAFPGGPPDPELGGPRMVEDKGHLSESLEPASIIVVADVDMLTNQIAFRRFNDAFTNNNQDFMLNAMDRLAGSEDLIKIRSRGSFRRPFGVVAEIEEEADRKSIEQTQAIEARKLQIQRELAALRAQANRDNLGILRAEAQDKQRVLESESREQERRLRQVQQEKTEAIESLGSKVKNLNMILVPSIILLFGVFLGFFRYRKRRALVLGGVS
ncbi:MAG: Gldg family protein [Planctomycetota bacterium]|jgi:ABC-type uncharacterized transport system involved in gliding motility auxiliary subunit